MKVAFNYYRTERPTSNTCLQVMLVFEGDRGIMLIYCIFGKLVIKLFFEYDEAHWQFFMSLTNDKFKHSVQFEYNGWWHVACWNNRVDARSTWIMSAVFRWKVEKTQHAKQQVEYFGFTEPTFIVKMPVITVTIFFHFFWITADSQWINSISKDLVILAVIYQCT